MFMWRAGRGFNERSTNPSGDCTSSPRWGVTTVPPLAIVAYATASWSGVTCTSPCPTARLSLSPIDQGRLVPSAIPHPPAGRLGLRRQPGCSTELVFTPLVYLNGPVALSHSASTWLRCARQFASGSVPGFSAGRSIPVLRPIPYWCAQC